jgi:hypothetical protein
MCLFNYPSFATGEISTVAYVPGIVQVCINAYSPLSQTFYLAAQSEDRTQNKVRRCFLFAAVTRIARL